MHTTVMGIHRLGSDYTDHVVNNNLKMNSNADIANMFNNCFINISPELSKDITVQTNASIYDYLETNNNRHLFLTAASEKEGIRMVNTWESKISTYLRFGSFSLDSSLIRWTLST